jgi:hypothetical protein
MIGIEEEWEVTRLYICGVMSEMELNCNEMKLLYFTCGVGFTMHRVFYHQGRVCQMSGFRSQTRDLSFQL